ncbi:uncharacterized protein C2845_PM15G08880 [Panicum miliaceum]|uniref:T-complex protein 11-like protein 1 n=1 Tax=Panicum miliaceum TaxID=4540 RepID=A0A3L6QB08_PANMI|nr:uncharacterized protein C2845_PM15G08880 [Panicum miliaceum]
MSMQSPAVLQAAKALLDRLERRLVISHSAASSSPVENVDHLLKHLASPPRRRKGAPPSRERTARAAAAKRPATSSGASRWPRYSPRVVLCAYMIVAHPGAVLSGSGEVQGSGGGGFDKAWCAYLYRFMAWKVKDDLVRTAWKLELSMMQTCKVAAADGRPPSDLTLTHDMKAIRQQVADDQKLLREKVRQLSGAAGVERMDSAISDARSKFLEAKKKGSPVATPVANVSTPLSVDSSPSGSTSPAKQPTENERMVNEMLHQDGGDFGGRSYGAATATAEKDFEKKVREAMEKAFWDLVTESLRGDKPDYSQLVSLVKEVRDSLHELAPKELKEEIVEHIDLDILSQVLGSGSQHAQHLGQILQYSLATVRKLSAAAKEDEMKKSHEKLLSELAAMSKARIQMVMQPIVRGSTGVEYLQKAFADRHAPPANASASLPLTLQFISASKSVAEQEWSEHSECLSAMPSSAGQAPALVPVLRAGHGAAPAAQPPPSSSAAAGASGQPECKGERLDKLINLMRLRAVQSQFQQVIVIATSMLTLRQVLMVEKPKVTPAELELSISELFEALLKILDGSPDAGADEIVEAMISASASAGSPSEEKIRARRQMIARVFLKSLRPGDMVFKMVSRAVHCAFRGVVLGGSGPRGRKLADAALWRVAAAKLVDRVVKAAEVVIKVATVSEKVHGPWYTALM